MLAQALEDLWAISPDPRRDRLTAAFITHAVALATGVSPSDIASAKRTSKAAARARQIAIYLAHGIGSAEREGQAQRPDA